MSELNSTHRINDQILRSYNDLPKAREVRLVNDDGRQEILPTTKALEIAKDSNLDLIEIAPYAHPPVCKILDYGKYKYQLAKKQKENQAATKQVDIKTLTIGVMIDNHDFIVKMNNAKKFLQHGDKVKVLVKLKGRELNYPEYASELMQKISNFLSDLSVIEKPAVLDGKSMLMILSPKV
jgi:translation initiation factor IF-3